MAGIFVVELAMGWITIDGMFVTLMPFPFIAAFLLFLIQMTLVGTYEELVFRGFQIKNIAEGLSVGSNSGRTALLLAWVVTSILFGLIHAMNPGATVGTTLKITIAGVLPGPALPVNRRTGHLDWRPMSPGTSSRATYLASRSAA